MTKQPRYEALRHTLDSDMREAESLATDSEGYPAKCVENPPLTQ